jgi:hypothetical protein
VPAAALFARSSTKSSQCSCPLARAPRYDLGTVRSMGVFKRFLASFRPQPIRPVAALGLDVDGHVHLGADRASMQFVVTGGVEHHLDADCQVLFTRRAVRVGYTIPFAPAQLQAIRTSPLMVDVINSFHDKAAHGKLYVCDGRVDHATLINPDGNELEWSTQSIWTPHTS